MATLIRIKNTADEDGNPIHYFHQGEVVHIEPGEDTIVTMDVAAAMFGNPDLADDGRNNLRMMEFKRIKHQWGFQIGTPDSAIDWEMRRPRFRCETLDGEYMPMVLDDPDAKLPLPGMGPAPVPVDATVALLQQQLAAMQANQDKLMEMLSTRLAAENPGNVEPVVATVDSAALPAAPADSGVVTSDAPRTTRIRN